ncbi:hypothetical protein PTI98_013357 [Pleurotus ostreatus]|nr:hypothetical protein PTI98_013357 [Pleurotus ostreatus]
MPVLPESSNLGQPQPGCCHLPGRRNICLSMDGFFNPSKHKNSNINELHNHIVQDSSQVSQCFSSGAPRNPSVYHSIEMTMARNFERTLLEAYAWLCTTYIPGDRIFLFGFSRGAYGVRIIADMIERVGLLYNENINLTQSVFKTYMCTRGTRSADGLKHAMELKCKIVKSDLSHAEVKVHFVGVWDTTSFGVVGFGSGAPETVKGMKHICHIRHALALDEKRVSYRQASTAESDLPEGTEKKYSGGNIKEVWFEGSHSDLTPYIFDIDVGIPEAMGAN